jgi:serine beta-lactamase-like protein LACTB
MKHCSYALLALAALLSGPAQAERPALSARDVKAIRVLVEKTMADEHAPGMTVAIGLNDKLAWSEGFGLADVENNVRATPDTEYRTASIGKPMTATAAMELVEQGKLDLDAPIQKYCPRFPQKQWAITARELIAHTSGIRHYEGPNEDTELFNTQHYDHASDALDIFDKDPLKFQPGTGFAYSTWGYVTLGCVLEGATGEDYRTLMQRLIFTPAQMTNTRDDDPRAIIAHHARGYIIEDGALKVSRWADMSSKMAAGGWVTTAPDLVKFMHAFMDGKLVSAKTAALMIKPVEYPLGDGKSTVDNFGFGWATDVYRAMPAATFGGGTPQVSGFIFFVPEKHLAIAEIFNLENIPGGHRAALAQAIADVVLGEKMANTAAH